MKTIMIIIIKIEYKSVNNPLAETNENTYLSQRIIQHTTFTNYDKGSISLRKGTHK